MAWAYSGKGQKEFAADVDGVDYHRLRAILAQSDTSAVTVDELFAIADAAGVPRWFMTDGFEGDRLAAVEGRLSRLERQVKAQPAPSTELIEQVIGSLRSQGWTPARAEEAPGSGRKDIRRA
jgi:hypothetical protein